MYYLPWCTCITVQIENLKLLSEALLDNYRITIDVKKKCTKVLLDWASPLKVGMKTDRNGWENCSTISVSVFYYGKREQEWNSWVEERKRGMMVMEMGGNKKIYRNTLLFNHHSLCMNIILDTPLHKLFFKNMINVSCFLRLNREIYVLMLRNMYWC